MIYLYVMAEMGSERTVNLGKEFLSVAPNLNSSFGAHMLCGKLKSFQYT